MTLNINCVNRMYILHVKRCNIKVIHCYYKVSLVYNKYEVLLQYFINLFALILLQFIMDCGNGKLAGFEVIFHYFIALYFSILFYCETMPQYVIGLSELTLTTNAADAGDEDVFMVRRFS